MKVLSENESAIVSGAEVLFAKSYLENEISIHLTGSSDSFKFQNLTFTPNGCFYNGSLINPNQTYSGYKIETSFETNPYLNSIINFILIAV